MPPLTPHMSGQFSTPSWAGDHSLLFSRAWAERLTTQIEVVRAAAETAQLIDRQIEYMEEWSPSELDYDRAFRALWSECVLTVWIADGLDRWLNLLAREIGEDPPAPIVHLRHLRNALMHLDEASFDQSGAHAGPTSGQNRSLRELPGSRLLVQSWSPDSPLFDLLDVAQLETIASELLTRLDVEMNALVDEYVVQAEIDRRRGK